MIDFEVCWLQINDRCPECQGEDTAQKMES